MFCCSLLPRLLSGRPPSLAQAAVVAAEDRILEFHFAAFSKPFTAALELLRAATTSSVDEAHLQLVSTALKSKSLARSLADINDLGFDKMSDTSRLDRHRFYMPEKRLLLQSAVACFESAQMDNNKFVFNVDDQPYTEFIGRLRATDLPMQNSFIQSSGIATVETVEALISQAQTAASHRLAAPLTEKVTPGIAMVCLRTSGSDFRTRQDIPAHGLA